MLGSVGTVLAPRRTFQTLDLTQSMLWGLSHRLEIGRSYLFGDQRMRSALVLAKILSLKIWG